MPPAPQPRSIARRPAADRRPAGSGAGWIRSSRPGLVLVTSRVGDPRAGAGGVCAPTGGSGRGRWRAGALDLAPHAGDRAARGARLSSCECASGLSRCVGGGADRGIADMRERWCGDMRGAYPVTVRDRREVVHESAGQAAGSFGLHLAQLRVSDQEAPALHALKVITNSGKILLVFHYLRPVRSGHRESAVGSGQLHPGSPEEAGHGPHRPDHHRRHGHGPPGARSGASPTAMPGL